MKLLPFSIKLQVSLLVKGIRREASASGRLVAESYLTMVCSCEDERQLGLTTLNCTKKDWSGHRACDLNNNPRENLRRQDTGSNNLIYSQIPIFFMDFFSFEIFTFICFLRKGHKEAFIFSASRN